MVEAARAQCASARHTECSLVSPATSPILCRQSVYHFYARDKFTLPSRKSRAKSATTASSPTLTLNISRIRMAPEYAEIRDKSRPAAQRIFANNLAIEANNLVSVRALERAAAVLVSCDLINQVPHAFSGTSQCHGLRSGRGTGNCSVLKSRSRYITIVDGDHVKNGLTGSSCRKRTLTSIMSSFL